MIRTIGVGQLALGMYAHELNASWLEHSFWRLRFKLTDEQDLHRIRVSGIRELKIDTRKGLDIEADAASGLEQAMVAPVALEGVVRPEANAALAARTSPKRRAKVDREAAVAEAAESHRTLRSEDRFPCSARRVSGRWSTRPSANRWWRRSPTRSCTTQAH